MLGEKDSYNVKRQYKEMFSYFTHWSIYRQASFSVNKVCLYECVCVCVCVCCKSEKKVHLLVKTH